MSIEIKVPPLPESVTDATLVAWHKQPGETVSRDESLADLETDKVVLEVPAPVSGTLLEIKVKDGATVIAGDVLAILEEGEVVAAAVVAKRQESPQAKTAAAEPKGESQRRERYARRPRTRAGARCRDSRARSNGGTRSDDETARAYRTAYG
jgi:2-oxoglutarate dehydrogenase E2 component (dihydrolipoamide succinyltransferase)